MGEIASALINFLASIRDTFLVFTVVDAWEKGVVLRLGKPVRDVGPGLRWHLPLHIERVLVTNCAIDTVDLPVQSCITADDHEVAISAVIQYRVHDARKMLIDVAGDEGVLADASRGVIRKMVQVRSLEQLCETETDDALTTAVRKRAWKWGIEVIEVQLSDLTTATTYRIMGDSGTLIPQGAEEE